MNFWVERVIPLVDWSMQIRLDAERRASMKCGVYTASYSRYLVLGTFEDFGIECWHPFRKYPFPDIYDYECLLCRCYYLCCNKKAPSRTPGAMRGGRR